MFDTARVILVDDDEASNVFHEIVLRRAGFDGELAIFDSPVNALAALNGMPAAGKPTLILLDINMPRMDGFQFVDAAAARLRADPSTAVMLLSSSSADEDLERARAEPLVREYLVKPLGIDTAKELLNRCFG